MSIFRSIQSVQSIKNNIQLDELKRSSREAISRLNAHTQDTFTTINPDGRGSVEFLRADTQNHNYNDLDSNELAAKAKNFRI